jgi:hypothetical protein
VSYANAFPDLFVRFFAHNPERMRPGLHLLFACSFVWLDGFSLQDGMNAQALFRA